MTTLNKWKGSLMALPEQMFFSRWPIDSRTVFHVTDFSFAFTNLKPVIPGHVLVSPKRIVSRLGDLSESEVADLFSSARLVGKAVLSAHPESDSLTLTVQDGTSAGQTVPHVHVHVMPRSPNDIFNTSRKGNDAVYEAIETNEKQMMDQKPDIPVRSREDMIKESLDLRKIMEHVIGA
jgi:diadenosine tetraphosphate (Ap4A) HIT family hydrolase